MPKAVLAALLLLLLATPAEATFCADPVPYVIEIADLDGDRAGNACSNGFNCNRAETSGPEVTLADPTCDPTTSPCSVKIRVPLVFPGIEENIDDAGGTSGAPLPVIYYFNGGTPPACTPSPPFDDCGAIAICGQAGGPRFTSDLGETTITLGGVSCENVETVANVLSVSVFTCISSSSCRQRLNVPDLAFGGPAVAAAIGCPRPPVPRSSACNGDEDCRSCPAGGASVGGGGPAVDLGGPGAKLRYAAGGVGDLGMAGTDVWRPALGRFWSHDYAERLVLDPDATHVWLLTRHGTFREFSDPESDGSYDVLAPSDEYRALTATAGGWELVDLDGTVQRFDSQGRWVETEDRFGNAKTATYDGSGNLTQVAFPDGRSETFTYHPSGKLASITEVGVGGTTTRTWSLTWSGDDLTRLDRPDGTAWVLSYGDAANPGYLTKQELLGKEGGVRVERAWEHDGQGNVLRTWRGDAAHDDPAAVDRGTFSYDDPFEPTVTAVTDPLGKVATYTLDRDPASTKPRVLGISGDCPACGLGPSAQLSYGDSANPLQPTLITDGKGHQTLLTYDGNGMLTSRTEALGEPEERTTTWTYHASYPALPTLIERPSVDGGASLRTTTLVYDVSGALVQQIEEGVENGSAFLLSTLHAVNTAGETTSVDPPGYGTADATTFTYDPSWGDLIPLTRTDPLIGTTTFGYDPLNRRTSVTDPNGVTTETEYDKLSRVTRIIQKGEVLQDDLVTQHVYSEFGDLLRTVLPRGNVIEYGYDSAGRLISLERKPNPTTPAERTLFTLDEAGNRVREELQSWNGAAWETASATDFVYSTRCHLDRILQAPGTPEQTITDYSYDCNGNLAQVWDANRSSAVDSPSTTYSYDALDRLVSLTQPWAGGGTAVTAYTFDVQDHLTSVTDAEGNTTTYTYSDRDLLTKEISPGSGTTTHLYNEHGELISTTDARGITVTRTVDALDRVTLVDYSGTTLDVAYTYDAPAVPFSLGRLTAIQRGRTSILYAYDRFGRTTQDGQLGYTFDENGNRTEIHYPGGVTATYTYDFADRQETLSVQVGTNPVQSLVTSSSYLPSGPLTSLALGNGLTETRTFDDRYVPEKIQVPGRLDWTYSTDGVGNVLSITDGLDPAQNRAYAYQDVHYFLTQGNGPWGTRGWSYDKIGNRLTETRDGVTDTYTYAPSSSSGNTTLLTQISLGTGGTKTYTHGPAGHLTQVNAAGNQVIFVSDAEGRLSALERPLAGARTEMLYDGRSFLTEAVEPQIFSDGFESGDFSCWSAVVGGTKTGTCPTPPPSGSRKVEPTYSSEGLLHARTADALSELVLYFAGRPVAVLSVAGGVQQGLTYLTTDHLGTPALATDAAGGLLWSGGFEPFGEDWNGADSAGVFLRLPGQWDDPAWAGAGLGAKVYYNLHRWYEPANARYTKPDPYLRILIGRPYSYSRARPLSHTDPLGLFEDQHGPGHLPHGGPHHYMRPPEGDLDCVARIRDQVRREASSKTRYQHCLGNCLITRQCPGGKSTAVLASLFKEFSDLGRCIVERKGGNCDSAFQPADFDDNESGRSCPERVTCQEHCERLREVAEPPAGPFGGLNPERSS